MPIDPVGKGGGAPPAVPGTSAAQGAEAPSKAFEIHRTRDAAKTGDASKLAATEAAASTPLGQLRAGKIDVNQYVDLKLDDATKHLGGLPPAELAHVRGVLRDKIVHDPQLAELVRQATGSVPTRDDE